MRKGNFSKNSGLFWQSLGLCILAGFLAVGLSSCGGGKKSVSATPKPKPSSTPKPPAPPPSVDWDYDFQNGTPLNYCHSSSNFYFAQQPYVTVYEPVYGYVYNYYNGYYCLQYMGYYYYFAASGNCNVGYYPPPWTCTTGSCGGGGGGGGDTPEHYDSGWEPIAKVSSGSFTNCSVDAGQGCNGYCGSKKPSDFINNHSDLHIYSSCRKQNNTSKDFQIFAERSSRFDSKVGSVSLYKGSAVTIAIEVDDDEEIQKAQEYYISISGLYDDYAVQNNEQLEVYVNGTLLKTVKDQGEGWNGCYIDKKVYLRSGTNRIEFRGPYDSVHLDGYRISSVRPSMSNCDEP